MSEFSQFSQKCTICCQYMWSWENIISDIYNLYHMVHADCAKIRDNNFIDLEDSETSEIENYCDSPVNLLDIVDPEDLIENPNKLLFNLSNYNSD